MVSAQKGVLRNVVGEAFLKGLLGTLIFPRLRWANWGLLPIIFEH